MCICCKCRIKSNPDYYIEPRLGVAKFDLQSRTQGKLCWYDQLIKLLEIHKVVFSMPVCAARKTEKYLTRVFLQPVSCNSRHALSPRR